MRMRKYFKYVYRYINMLKILDHTNLTFHSEMLESTPEVTQPRMT